jgi:SAM-dependent methyltransferase
MSGLETEIQDRALQATGCLCPACGKAKMRVFHEASDVPTNSCILLSTEEEARAYPRGDIKLGVCETCGFVFNTAFDIAKTEYSGRYEETQAYSGTFNKFHTALAERLIKKHGLYEKDVLEIGCGKGEFIAMLADLGSNRGVGIDPGVDVSRIEGKAASQVKFIADFYNESYGDHKVDFLACKMTLEHIPEALEFVSVVRRGLGDQTDAIIFFQVPEAGRILGECAFEDVYYEHCAYFTPGSLARMFRQAGFAVDEVAIEYGEQYLTIEARPNPRGAAPTAPLAIEDSVPETLKLVDAFTAQFARTLAKWKGVVDEATSRGETIVLWGSGSKAVSFLTTLNVGDDVKYVTDINPHRHNHYMPITAQRIVPPAELAEIKPDLVICLNRIYEDEIKADLSALGLKPRVMSL